MAVVTSVQIGYRVRVPRGHEKNICREQGREHGFYWLHDNYEVKKELGEDWVNKQVAVVMNYIDRIEDIPNAMKLVEYPSNAEAIKVEVSVGYEGSDKDGYFNGSHRLNAKYEYFHTIMED